MSSDASPLQGWALWQRLLLISLCWGSAFPAVRFAAAAMPPLALACARGAVAAMAVLTWLWLSGALRRDRGSGGWTPRMGRHALVLGTTNGWLPNVMTAVALTSLPAAQGALIQSATPLFVALLASLLLPEERPGPRTLAGLALGFAGIAAVLGPAALTPGADLVAGLLMLGSAASYAVGTVYVRAVRPGSAAQTALGQQTVAALSAGLLVGALGAPGDFVQPAPIWAAVLMLGVLASALPVTLFTALAQRARATDAAMVGYLQPVVATVMGIAWLGEFPSVRVVAGGVVVLAGVWLATGGRARA